MKTSLKVARMFVGELFPIEKEDVSIDQIEAMIQKADFDDDVGLGYALREKLVFTARRAAKPDKSLVAFAWCLAKTAHHPELIKDEDDCALLAWQYRMAIISAVVTPEIERAKIESLLDQFEIFVTEHGFMQRTADDTRREVLMKMGHIGQAKKLLDKWEATPKTNADPCRACEQAARVDILAAEGDDSGAVDLAMKVLSETECKGAIGRIRRVVTRPLLRLERSDDVQENHKVEVKRTMKDPVDLLGLSEQLLCLCFEGKVAEAIVLFEKAALETLELTDQQDLHAFYSVASAMMKCAGSTTSELRIKLPAFWKEHRTDAVYDASELSDSFYAEAKKISDAFDKRNGNDAYQQQLQQTIEFLVAPN